jgi:large subunit ribosomal protein L24
MSQMKIKKGDTVVVLTGRDKGKSGEVLRALPRESKVVVQGINIAKRHTRQSPTSQGGIVEKEMPIHVSNVSHIDPKDNKPTRVGFKILKDGTKQRVAKRSGEAISEKA